MAMTTDDAFEFFNRLSGTLEVELSRAAEPIAPGLLNLRAPEAATVVKVRLELEHFEEGSDEPRPLTADEWALIVLRAPSVVLRGEAGTPVDHRAPNGQSFTLRELTDAVIETERATRGETKWFGGVDVHHVFFEGLHRQEDGTWAIAWGS